MGKGAMSQSGGLIVVSPGEGRDIRQGNPRGAVKLRNQDFKLQLTLKRQIQTLIEGQPKSRKCKGGKSLFFRCAN
jgi:predicted phosphodiesterase